MSGHSKWSTIKRKKGAEDAKRAKIFTRLARDIAVAARESGPDPDSNPRLALAIDKAKAANMPKDNIERAVNKGAGIGGEADNYEELIYEGYGPHGVAILIDVLTDNRNRSLAEIKHAFNKFGGNLATTNAVQWQFDQKGFIELKSDSIDYDELFLAAAEAGAEDVVNEDELFIVYSARNDLNAVETTLNDAGYKISDSKLVWVPQNEVALEPNQVVQVFKLIERLEELDDVQTVSTNLQLDEQSMAALEAV
jgi:YebC/PmpR family DNA-binding regulatory protein